MTFRSKMGGCNWNLFLPAPVKQVSGCSLYISYSVHDSTESLFWTTRRNNLFEVFWENCANGSCLVPSTTSLPKICAAFLLSTLSLPTQCLLFNKNHFKRWLLELGVEKGIMTDVKILFHGLSSKKGLWKLSLLWSLWMEAENYVHNENI